MNSLTQSKLPSLGTPVNLPEKARILIVCDDEAKAEALKAFLRAAGLPSECANSLTAGCEAAKSGQFQLIVTVPLLRDGSWKRLIDIARYYDLGFEVVLWASQRDSLRWMEAMDAGAFDVIDSAYEQPKAIETAKRALWAAYLKGASPRSRGPLQAA